MFKGLSKRTAGQSAHFLKSTIKFHSRLPIVNSLSAVPITYIRHQSSSSSSRDNGNSNSPDMEPLSTNETPFNASFELHRVDLAHGSFFALHRPLLGIANGPMFANNQGNNMMNEEDYEDPVEDLTSYFSTLQPYSPPTPPLLQPSVGTPTATSWASLPQSLMDAEQTVDEFLSQIQVQQQQKSDYTMDTETPNNSPNKSNSENSFQNDSISVAAPPAESILDPLLDQRNMMHLTSVLRKRRIKMRKHKYKKLRKRTRALRKKLGK